MAFRIKLLKNTILFLYISIISKMVYGSNFNSPNVLNFNLGLNGLSFNNKLGMKFGAITPSISYLFKNKHIIGSEFYNFGYFYGYTPNYIRYKEIYGGTSHIDVINFKLLYGQQFEFKPLSIIPNVSINHRHSKYGHNFVWPNNTPTQLNTYAHSPFKSFGVGAGLILNIKILKKIIIGTEIHYSRYFDKRKIYAYEVNSDRKRDVSDEWKEYKPLNNVINFQVKLGFLFNLKKSKS